MKQYKNAGITNIKSDLVYDRSGLHKISVDIIFAHEGSGFDAVMDAYGDLVEDIHQLLRASRGLNDLPTRLEGSE